MPLLTKTVCDFCNKRKRLLGASFVRHSHGSHMQACPMCHNFLPHNISLLNPRIILRQINALAQSLYIRILEEMGTQSIISLSQFSSPMASFGKLVFCYFLVALFSSSLIHARESKFFSKFTHYSITKNVKKSNLSPIEAPAPTPSIALAPTQAQAPAPTPESIYMQSSENGDHGLYGQGSGLFPPAKETATENKLFNEEFDGETYEKEYQSSNYNNNGFAGNYNYNNGVKFASESHETGDQNNYNGYTESFNNNGYEAAGFSYNNKNGYNSNYKNNGYVTEQRQGMSDTRFVEGGKYYYDVKNENYYYPANGYESGKVSNQNQVYYGNSENQNEFNTMEFEDQELYNEESPEDESLP